MRAKLSSFKRDNMRTVVETVPMPERITYADKIMLIGSCFTEHIGNRLGMMKFDVNMNPFGIVYNPLSIADQLQYLLNPTGFSHDDLVFHQDLWHSWMHHGRFSNPDPDLMIRSVNNEAHLASQFFENAGMLVLTFGTAEAFYLKNNNRLVSNCHQLPADMFYSRKPDPHELAGIWIPLIETLKRRNPDLRICITISPVRYFASGPTGNQVSKSILFLFLSMLLKVYPDIYYFPSYEIFMDDLRDYRFYDTDLMHPGPAGIEYVWDRFRESCLDPSIYPLMDEVESIMKAVRHRPGSHLTDIHRRFVRQQTEKIAHLQLKYPFLDFEAEMACLESRLGSDQA